MMKPIANIVTTSNKLDFKFNYNKCKTLEEADKTLPTLIVGYNLAREVINGFNILKKSYLNDKIWWTFLKTERRIDYDRDISMFNDLVIDNLTRNINYELIDVINLNKETKDKIFNILFSDTKKQIYNHFDKFLFILFEDSNKIYGLPLTTCRFCGCDTNKLINKFKTNKNNKFIYNFNNIPSDIRRAKEANIIELVVLNQFFS